MKKIYAVFILACFALNCLAQSYDSSSLIITQQLPGGLQGQVPREVKVLPSSASGLFALNGATAIPQYFGLGATMSLVCGSGTPATCTLDALVKPGGSPSQYVRGDGTLATLPSAARTYTNPTRSLNTAYQISTAQDAQVSYSIGVEVAGLLSVTAVKTVGVLEYADNSAMTTNLVQVDTGKSGAGGLINLANSGTIKLTGGIPAGKWVRLRTTNTGAPTVTLDNTQEVLQ